MEGLPTNLSLTKDRKIVDEVVEGFALYLAMRSILYCGKFKNLIQSLDPCKAKETINTLLNG